MGYTGENKCLDKAYFPCKFLIIISNPDFKCISFISKIIKKYIEWIANDNFSKYEIRDFLWEGGG